MSGDKLLRRQTARVLTFDIEDCEVEGDVFSLGQLEDISVNYTNTASSYSEGSYDEDRPQSVIKKTLN